MGAIFICPLRKEPPKAPPGPLNILWVRLRVMFKIYISPILYYCFTAGGLSAKNSSTNNKRLYC